MAIGTKLAVLRKKMRTIVPRKWVLLLVGWTFVLLGILGLFLPVLQGVLFLLVGLIILSSEYLWAQKILTSLRNRFPRSMHIFYEAAERAREWLGGAPSR